MRESPMWAVAITSSTRTRALTVVPIPVSSGRSSTAALISWFAAIIADCSATSASWGVAKSSRSVSAMRRTAMAEAMSPPAWPPMPSATTKSASPAYPESWFWVRTRPTWLTAAPVVIVAPRSATELERGRAHLHRHADGHLGGGVDAGTVDERAVRRVEGLHDPVGAPQQQARVMGGRVVVTDLQPGVARAPDHERLRAEGDLEAGLAAGRDDQHG